jgi:hypothetical protein
MSVSLFLATLCTPCVVAQVFDDWYEEGASFYRWGGENVHGLFLIPTWKAPNWPPCTLNLDKTSIPTLGMAVSCNWQKLGPNRPGGGVAAPWLSPNAPIFGGSPLVSLVTWPMVVFHEVEVICFGYGLVLLIFGLLVPHSSGPSLLGLCRMAFTLCSIVHSLSFICISTNALL